MKIQELIRKYEELWEAHIPFHEPVPYTSMVELFLKELKQLDEPQKVKVPQFVADWYEENKDEFELNLWVFLTDFDEENIDMSERFGIWLGDEDNNPIQTLVNMHQFGYEVEKEKRYIVKMKGIEKDRSYLAFGINLEIWFFTSAKSTGVIVRHTRKKLEEAGFGWVFDCPGIEIEEVTE